MDVIHIEHYRAFSHGHIDILLLNFRCVRSPQFGMVRRILFCFLKGLVMICEFISNIIIHGDLSRINKCLEVQGRYLENLLR